MNKSNLKIIENYLLAPLTTFGIGGSADYFIEANTTQEIIEAIKWAKTNNQPFFILGGGSNVLIGDKGIRGLMIRIKNDKLRIKNDIIEVDVGYSLGRLVEIAQENCLSGLEGLWGIPGTVGGAIWGNAGTKLGNIGDIIETVTVFDNNNFINLNKTECQFNYRTSRFQQSQEIIISAVLKLKKADPEIILQNINETKRLRSNQPVGKSSGCFFKNPLGQSAGELIDLAGFKGMKVGETQVSMKHANFIMNNGRAKAKDVLKLAGLIKTKVAKISGVKLQEEVKIIGDN